MASRVIVKRRQTITALPIFQVNDQIPGSGEAHPLPYNLEKKGEGFALVGVVPP